VGDAVEVTEPEMFVAVFVIVDVELAVNEGSTVTVLLGVGEAVWVKVELGVFEGVIDGVLVNVSVAVDVEVAVLETVGVRLDGAMLVSTIASLEPMSNSVPVAFFVVSPIK